MKYIYTVTNIEPTNENINSIYRRLNGNFKDMTSNLDTNDVRTTELVSINICQ